ncbi:phosphoglycerate kinase [Candidatus Microgenomates bacterium]|nr:phosphoglycerate kinase [Candidatus Microgenomates bacterium]
MKLPIVSETSIKGRRVLVRLDTDVPLENGKVVDDYRLKSALPTLELLKKYAAQIIILGHIDHPQRRDTAFSIRPIANYLSDLLHEEITVVELEESKKENDKKVRILENLRFNNGEEKNDSKFVKRLAQLGDFYINESFADSHRRHASIVGLPKLLPHGAGFHLTQEVEHLLRILEKPKDPVIIIIGGAKSDKVTYIDKLLDHADWVLVGGLLPRVVSSYCRMHDGRACVVAGFLDPTGRDIDEVSATNFAAMVANAGTVVWNGPLGEYEKETFRKGTEVVARALGESDAYKVVGGGDTVAVLKNLGILDTMDWVSTGGGAMLEFLAEGDLPGLKALRI